MKGRGRHVAGRRVAPVFGKPHVRKVGGRFVVEQAVPGEVAVTRSRPQATHTQALRLGWFWQQFLPTTEEIALGTAGAARLAEGDR